MTENLKMDIRTLRTSHEPVDGCLSSRDTESAGINMLVDFEIEVKHVTNSGAKIEMEISRPMAISSAPNAKFVVYGLVGYRDDRFNEDVVICGYVADEGAALLTQMEREDELRAQQRTQRGAR